ncbi:MAG: flagellar filament capping protein FliD [Deltaproteobacteria bacterium]|nr:flagellar filament capping protein FliD [Candidatus Anaeroferrophillus wilburensis]MBN2888358.1 flagellar filament capping protein FliD [Deltaproteobacteria bacterium]
MAGTITTLGLGSGIDLQGMLEQLKAVDQLPIVRQEARQVEYKAQLTEFDTVNTKLLAVKTAALSLSLNDTFDTKTISSSNETVLTATGSSSATAGSYDLTVTDLARKNSWQSSGVAARDSIIATVPGEFTYTVNGQQSTITVTENMTLEELMTAINEDDNNRGITATVMDDGSGSDAFHLTLVSDETGEENAITLDTNGTDLTFNEIQAAGTLDARFTLNGISYQRSSNSIDDVITGITLSLQDTGSSTVKISADTSTISGKIVSLVEAYNDAMEEIATKSSYDVETGESGLLSGLSTFTTIKSQLNSILFGTIEGLSGDVNSLIELGLDYSQDGTVSINEATLNSALADNLENIKEFFVGSSSGAVEGFADRLDNQLGFLTNYNGLIDNEKARVQSAIDRLDDQMAAANARLTSRYETMARTFAELDKFMSSMEAQGNALNLQIESLSNLLYNNN